MNSNMKFGNRHRHKEKVINSLNEPDLPMKKFIMNMPEDLHLEFKLLCVSKGITMKDVIIEHVKKWVNENKKDSYI